MKPSLDAKTIDKALRSLNDQLFLASIPPVNLVVCGGAALSVLGLLVRTTKDIDVLALRDPISGELLSPVPLPPYLTTAAEIIAEELKLPGDWLNNGPSSDQGGLFQMGLPEGLSDRLTTQSYGVKISVSYISRYDQIHLKLYASIDQPGSYHTTDLVHLRPSSEEIESAAKWAMTHDVSEGFRNLTVEFLNDLGYRDAAQRILARTE